MKEYASNRGDMAWEKNKIVSNILKLIIQWHNTSVCTFAQSDQFSLSTQRLWLDCADVQDVWSHCRAHMSERIVFHITKTRLFKYIENFTSKNWKFSDKKLW